MEASFDVFLGHATVDKVAGVRDFADRLKERGLRVFVDEREIAEYGSITREVEQAIEGSLAFVAWYSTEYPARRACQLELRRSEEHTSELQSPDHLVCRLLLEKKKKKKPTQVCNSR